MTSYFEPRDGADAFRDTVRNQRARWSAAAETIGSECFEPNIDPLFKLRRSDKVFTIGSCFAQSVQQKLIQMGFDVTSWLYDEAIPADKREFFMQGPLQGVDGVDRHFWPGHFFHRYTPASLVAELLHLTDASPALESGALLIENKDGSWSDYHYHPAFLLSSRDACLERRAFVRERLGRALRNADVVVLTLGLVETWVDGSLGVTTNVPPPFAECARERGRYTFSMSRWRVTRELIGLCVDRIRSVAPNARVLLTVSPIPLDATFTADDVAVATMHGKSMLLSAARDVLAEQDAAQYFPSYEMAMLSDRRAVWTDDQRHVQPEFVQKIMSHFASTFVEN